MLTFFFLLQETDFVCFDGGRDDFDNYNVEELLGFLELYSSATGDSEKAIEKTQREDTPPEVLEESDLETEPVEVSSEEGESVSSENTKELRERSGAQKNHPHGNSQADRAQGDPSSFEPFEELLQDKLKVPESENNKTSNGSQVSSDQEKMDAYKLLKKEMTLDLKTKFGSTADALVSDDETTRLVTSLEDDFDEDSDTEYYTVGKEEEENEENFDELPLLTFTHGGEDVKTPAKSGVEKYSADREQSSNGEDTLEAAQPPGIRSYDKNILTTWEDTVFSFTEDDGQTGVDLGSSDSEEGKEGDDGFVPDSKRGKPRSATDDTDPKKVEDSLLTVDVPKTNNDKDPEILSTEEGRKAEESKRGLAQAEVGLQEEKQEGVTAHGSPQSSDPGSSPAAGKGKEMLESELDNKKNDLKGTAIHVSKGMLHEGKPGEQILGGGSALEPVPEASGSQGNEEKVGRESVDVAPPLGGHQRNASKDRVGEEHALVSAVKPHMLSVEPLSEEFKDEQLKTRSQPRPSPLDEIDLPREPEEEGPILGRNLSWPQGREEAVAHGKQVGEKIRQSEEEGKEDPSGEELAPHKPGAGSREVEATGQADKPEGPGFHTEKPEAEDDYSPEELLEDENAVSAQQSKEKSPEVQGGRLDVNLQAPPRAGLGAINPDAEAEGSKEETSNILEVERESETLGQGLDTGGREAGSGVVETESPPAAKKAQRASEVRDSPDRKNQTLQLDEMFQDQDTDYFKEDSPEESAQKPGVEELSEEDQEDVEVFADTGSQGSATEEHGDDRPHWAPQTAGKPAHSDDVKDLPIIGSFFKEQQSLQRFQKYFDVHELEAMFHEMSLKLKAAQQESLPYNVDKVLDKVFRASESHILSIAEKMLDTRVTENRDLGMKENNIFEEAAVLDDIQDLIYFVRYRHSAVEATAPLTTTPLPQEGWGGSVEGKVPLGGALEKQVRGRG